MSELPYVPPIPEIFGDTEITCPLCGLKLYPTMGYVCSTPKCPLGFSSRYEEDKSTTTS